MKYKLVYIEWQDASSQGGWQTNKEIDKWLAASHNDAGFAKQVGWIIRETKRFIIMSSRHAVDNDYQAEQWGELQKIPKTWIRKRKVIKI